MAVPPPSRIAVAPEPAASVIAPATPVAIVPDDQPLVVALTDEAFAWFRAGEKSWEVRRRGRQFNENDVATGRAVALRRGFRADGGMTGRIERVVQAASVEAFLDTVPYHEVVPVAESRDEAVAIAKRLLGPGAPSAVIGFRIEIENRDAEDGESQARPPAAARRQARGR
jgi:hypothetical protein